MKLDDLLWAILAVAGKDSPRVAEILARGSLVSGASRLRWEGFEPGDLHALLGRYPDRDPHRVFTAAACFNAVLRGRSRQIVITREAGSSRKLFRRRSFWDALMNEAGSPSYVDYSYKERADVFTARADPETRDRLRSAASLLPYSTLEAHVRAADFNEIDFYVGR
jgi:hypothetical protein